MMVQDYKTTHTTEKYFHSIQALSNLTFMTQKVHVCVSSKVLFVTIVGGSNNLWKLTYNFNWGGGGGVNN